MFIFKTVFGSLNINYRLLCLSFKLKYYNIWLLSESLKEWKRTACCWFHVPVVVNQMVELCAHCFRTVNWSCIEYMQLVVLFQVFTDRRIFMFKKMSEHVGMCTHLIWAVSRRTNSYKIDISTMKTKVFFSKLSSNIQLVPIRTILLCRNMYHVASVDIVYIYKTKAELDLTSLYCFLLFSIPCYIFFCLIRKEICLSILLKFNPNNL